MCVIFIAYEQREDLPLVILANRDEFYSRPTLAAARWEDHPQITAGRDLAAGGTWLGVTDGGRFAAVTNYRDLRSPAGSISRGALVSNFLLSDEASESYLEGIEADADKYSGFNLITGEMSERRRELFYFSNRDGRPRRLAAGIYGLSNHLLNTSWPKVSGGTARFRELVAAEQFSREAAFRLLADETLAADEDLPDTGIGLERERVLSPIFVRTKDYGTRCSTVLTFDGTLKCNFEERVFV